MVTSCEFVDRAIEAASPTQLLLVRKQVTSGPIVTHRDTHRDFVTTLTS